MKTFDECYLPNYDSYSDLGLYEIGCQKCPPSYGYGPIIRDTYILHYILDGKGTLYANDKEYPVSDKQAFIAYPGELTYYEADAKEPWNYIWIRFHGVKVPDLVHDAGFSKDTPVFIPDSPCPQLDQCLLNILHHHDKEYACIGNVYLMFQLMSETTTNKPAKTSDAGNTLLYIKAVTDYITKKYSEPVRIKEIADYLGLDRSYLCKLFKRATNYTPMEYLISFRIRKARQLLKQTDLPIQHIAYSVGYSDPFAFSKLFKRETGMSPSDYRANSVEQARK